MLSKLARSLMQDDFTERPARRDERRRGRRDRAQRDRRGGCRSAAAAPAAAPPPLPRRPPSPTGSASTGARPASSPSPRARPASPTRSWPPTRSPPRARRPASTSSSSRRARAATRRCRTASIDDADAVIFATDVDVREPRTLRRQAGGPLRRQARHRAARPDDPRGRRGGERPELGARQRHGHRRHRDRGDASCRGVRASSGSCSPA